MKPRVLIGILIIFLLSGVYWYQATAMNCPVPLSYRIGSIDSNFSISKDSAIEYVADAEKVWETAVGRELFVYDEEAELTVNFVFDDRQQSADEEVVNRGVLDDQQAENEALLKTIDSLQSDYESLTNSYEARVANYETRLSLYNDKVNRYNDRGGAPTNIFQELEQEKNDLNGEVDELAQVTIELNDLVNKINNLSDRANREIKEYNRSVEDYNSKYGYVREFTQGDYQNQRINIYKFSNDAELVSVLAHELGHSLGIGHVEGDTSVMYYLMDEENGHLEVTESDKEAYKLVCGEEETVGQSIRRMIRGFLANI